jgi:hypothetical protein
VVVAVHLQEPTTTEQPPQVVQERTEQTTGEMAAVAAPLEVFQGAVEAGQKEQRHQTLSFPAEQELADSSH